MRNETSIAATSTMREDNALGTRKLWLAALFSVVAAVALLLASATPSWALATTPPQISSPLSGTYDNDGALTIKGSAPLGNVVKVYDGSNYVGQALMASYGQWELRLSGIAVGKHTYMAKAFHWTGSSSSWSNSVTVTVDSTAPAPPTITSPASSTAIINADVFTASGTAEPDSKVELFEFTPDGLASKGTAKADGSGNWKIAVTGVPECMHHYIAEATDLAGNVSGWSNRLTIVHVTETATLEDCTGQSDSQAAMLQLQFMQLQYNDAL